MTATTPFLLNEELAKAAATIFRVYKEGTHDVSPLLNKLEREKGDSKDIAFSVLCGAAESGIIEAQQILKIIDGISPTESEKRLIFLKRYMRSNPLDKEHQELLNGLAGSHAELLGEAILKKPGYGKKEVMKYLQTYTYSEQLWLSLASQDLIEDLKNRK